MLLFYTIIAAVFAVAGALFVLKTGELNKKHISRMLAVASGIMVSVTFLHILPDSFALDPGKTSLAFLAAIFLLFLIETFTIINSCNEFVEDCHVHTFGIFALAALALHSSLDGFNIGVSFSLGKTAGFNILAATVLHKFADGVTLASIMKHAGEKNGKTIKVAVLIALATPAGTLLSYMISSSLTAFMPLALGVTAASFVYISMTDILPHLHRERDYFSPLMFLAGYSFALLIHLIGE